MGDRIVLSVVGEPTLTDTFTVRAERKVLLPTIGELSLRGVLHSELRDFATTQVARYLKSPTVRATALLRVMVGGEVTKPGFYSVPSDILISDAIMSAGGPTGNASVEKTTVRRESKEIMNPSATSRAITSGATLDQLDVRAGDEILVGEKSGQKWSRLAPILTVTSTAVGLLFYALRR
ncbi:MAG: SLBB domain-containing protein [Gemmatimonadaceae bacterium]